MELKFRLLDHPFYQSWNKGEITKEQLSRYHSSYRELIKEMPALWAKIGKGLGVDSPELKKIVSEEASHISLWENWKSRLPEINEFPRMSELVDSLAKMTPSELLGAVHAFEIQQPEVAKTKKDGLMCHYGYTSSELKYFDEHINEQEHIDFGKMLFDNLANKDEFISGFDKGSELFYKALDLFIEEK